MKNLKVGWISAGISSFIACYLSKDIDRYIYIDIPDQHEDSMRFVKDCEKILGKKIEILSCTEYANVDEVIRAYGIIKNPYNQFAPCTNVLKKQVRHSWEQIHADYNITYVWGYDCTEKHRADQMEKLHPEFKHEFPLITHNLSKQDCHAMADLLNLKRPIMYDMGYNNNNCIGCIKGGMGYWNRIRIDFPEVFESRAKLERDIGYSFIKGVFLDELEPDRGNMSHEIMQDCSIMCFLAMAEVENEPEKRD